MRCFSLALLILLAGCGGAQPLSSKEAREAAVAHDAKMLQAETDQEVENQTAAINASAAQIALPAANDVGSNAPSPPQPVGAGVGQSR